MPPRGSSSKSKGKVAARRGRPEPATPSSTQQLVPRPINEEVLGALRTLWEHISEYLVLNTSGPFLAVRSVYDFISSNIVALVSDASLSYP